MHNGDVQLISCQRNIIRLKVYGACVGCPMADLTYNRIIGSLIMEEVPQIKKVIIE